MFCTHFGRIRREASRLLPVPGLEYRLLRVSGEAN